MNNIQKKSADSIKKPGRGGARPGAGRPKGSSHKVTIQGIIDTLDVKAGQTYDEILIEDFLAARSNDDRHLTLKYHNLIMNKLVSDRVSVDVTASEELLAARREAFDQAVASLNNIAGVTKNIKIAKD